MKEEILNILNEFACKVDNHEEVITESSFDGLADALVTKVSQMQLPVKPATCEHCKYWVRHLGDDEDDRFGDCSCPNTYSWVRGDDFEPPKDFGCINFKSKLSV